MSRPPEDAEAALDTALYDPDPVRRDAARGPLTRAPDPEVIDALIALMDAPHRLTRRRAARVLSEISPDRAGPRLRAALLDATAPLRARTGAARVLMVLAEGEDEALAAGLRDAEPRVRRACATPAAPLSALIAALTDSDPVVVTRVAEILEQRDHLPPLEALQTALATANDLPQREADAPPPQAALLRLIARADPTAPALINAARAGDPTALDHLADAATLDELLVDAPIAAAWGLARLGVPSPAVIDHADPRVRAAAARALPPGDARLATLVDDPDPGVAWLARRAQTGAFTPDALDRRRGRHRWLDAPSARPPYGLRPDDALPPVTRVAAALALCHPRFDVNLGVAVRSAEAAGLAEVFLIGRAELFRSPARGTDRALPLRHAPDPAALIRFAREGGYQLVAIQQTPDSVPFHRAAYPPRPLFIVGAEDEGVPEALRVAADLVVEIPQFGVIDSLNVAAAATTVLFHWRVGLA